MTEEKETPPIKQYKNAEGFQYSWGHILERRVDKYIVMEFCFGKLLSDYLSKGRRLHNLQTDVFRALEETVPYTTRDLVPVLSLEEKWQIFPCSTIGAFTLVIHSDHEEEARQWAALDLVCEAIPAILKELQEDVDKAKR